jgi:hypothetical protein
MKEEHSAKPNHKQVVERHKEQHRTLMEGLGIINHKNHKGAMAVGVDENS